MKNLTPLYLPKVDTIPLSPEVGFFKIYFRDDVLYKLDSDGVETPVTELLESDPIFTASPAFGISNTNIGNWNTSYNWGNHATQGYLTQVVTDALYAGISHTHSFAQITGKPTTLDGYGITDPVVLTSASYNNPAWINTLNWSKIVGAPSIVTSTGTSNYLPKWLGGVLTDSVIYENGGVGIGTGASVNVQSMLHVIGNATRTKSLLLDSTWDYQTSFSMKNGNFSTEFNLGGATKSVNEGGPGSLQVSMYNAATGAYRYPVTFFANGNVAFAGSQSSVPADSGQALQVNGAIKQTSVISALLKTNASGVLVAAVAGTDYLSSISSANVIAALGYTPVTNARILTINGTAYDLTADRSWTVGDVLTTGAYANPSWITSLAWSKITGAPAFITGITSSDVTTALGYTPVTNARTLTINGVTYDLTANRSWTISFTTPTLDQVTTAGNTTTNAITVGGLTSTGTIYAGVGSTTNGTIRVERSSGIVGLILRGSDGNILGASGYSVYEPYNYADASHNFNIGHASIGNFNWYVGVNTPLNSNTHLMRLTRGGNLLIGTTTDAGYKLDVNGTTRISNTLRVVGSAGYGSNVFEFGVNGGTGQNGYIDGYGRWFISNGGTNTLAATIGTNVLFLGQNANSAAIAFSNSNNIIGQWSGTVGTFNNTSTAETIIIVNNQATANLYGMTIAGDQTAGQLGSKNLLTLSHWGSSGVQTFGNTAAAQFYNLINVNIAVSPTQANKTLRGFYYNPSISGTALAVHRAIETTSGDVIFNGGNVGIGTGSPAYKLDVSSTGTTVIRSYGDTVGRISLQNSSKHYSLSTQGTNLYVFDETAGISRVLINTNGDIGIGTTSPGEKLHVVGNGFFTSTTGASVSIGTGFQAGSNASPLYTNLNFRGYADTIKAQIKSYDVSQNASTGVMIFSVAATGDVLTEYMRITATGNVGINTTSPGEKLQVAGNVHISGVGSALYFDTDASPKSISQYVNNLYELHIYNGRGATSRIIGGSGFVSLGSGTTQMLYINTSSGNVLIGTTTDSGFKLDVNGSSRATSFVKTGGTSSQFLKADGSVDSSTYITSAGNAATATTLQTARTLTIGNTGKTFNGSANVSWSLAEIQAEYQVPGNTLRANLGDPTVREAALFHGQFNNKFRFISPTLQEESTDGVTWTTSTRATTAQLGDMMRGEGEGTSFAAIPTGTIGTYGGYRLTWNVVGITSYVFLNALYVYNSTNGNNVTIKIEAYHNTNGWTTITGPHTTNTWPGHAYIPHTNIPYSNSATQYSQVRITFESTRNAFTNAFTIYAIEWVGGYPAGKRNAESYDRDKNVTFPANISAIGGLTGASLTVTGSVVASGGNSTNWNTAFGWGNHASAGYQTSTGTVANIASGTITDLNAAWTAPGTSINNGFRVYNYVDSATNKPASYDNANWLMNIYSHPSGGTASYGHQFAGSNTENIYIRSVSNGSFGTWRTLFHTGNVPNLGQVTSSGSSTTNTITVGRLNAYGPASSGIYSTMVSLDETTNNSSTHFGIDWRAAGFASFPFGVTSRISSLRDGSNSTFSLLFHTMNSGTLAENMRITGSGNVLIGTTTDAGQKLQVNGNLKATSVYTSDIYPNGNNLTFWVNALNSGSRFYFAPEHQDGRINFKAVANTNDYVLLRAWHSANMVGLGTGSSAGGGALSTYNDSVLIGDSGSLYFMGGTFGPLNVPYRLGITTSATTTTFASGVGNNRTNLDSNAFVYIAKSHTFYTGTTTGNQALPNQYTALFLSSTGLVGIGNTAPTTALDVSGVITATGGNSTQWNTAYGWGNHASAGYATTSYVTTQINNLINGAPGALDTLNELAAALGNDANFATTVTNSLASKVDSSRSITINGVTYDLTANRTWTISTDAQSAANGVKVVTPVNAGANVVASLSSTLYEGATFSYVIDNNTSFRAGTVIAVWTGTTVQFNETTTNDIGDTSGVTMSVVITGGNAQLVATSATAGWTAKVIPIGI